MIIMSMGTIAFASDENKAFDPETIEKADVITTESLELSTEDDAHFREQLEEIAPMLDLNYEVPKTSISENRFVKEYIIAYDNGMCYIDLYDNNSFEVYGSEALTDYTGNHISPKSTGYSSTGSGYKSFYRSATYGFSYTYKVSTNSSTHLSKISNKGGFTQFGTQYGYFSLNSLTYTRANQTSTKPAELVGSATLYSDGYNTGAVYKLITRVTSGTIKVVLNVNS